MSILFARLLQTVSRSDSRQHAYLARSTHQSGRINHRFVVQYPLTLSEFSGGVFNIKRHRWSRPGWLHRPGRLLLIL